MIYYLRLRSTLEYTFRWRWIEPWFVQQCLHCVWLQLSHYGGSCFWWFVDFFLRPWIWRCTTMDETDRQMTTTGRTNGGQDGGQWRRNGRRSTTDGRNVTFQIQDWDQNHNQQLHNNCFFTKPTFQTPTAISSPVLIYIHLRSTRWGWSQRCG